MKQDVKEMIEGYHEAQQENEILRKQPVKLSHLKGGIEESINLYHPKKLDLIVSEIREETSYTSTIRFISANGYLPPFQAGQYINLFVEVAGIRTSRPYSISSPPTQTAYYDITVQRIEGGFVSLYLMDELKVGQKLSSTSPSGYFYHNPLFHGKDLVFLAGGSGVTPFMSIIREVTDRGLDRNLHLIYGSRTEDDIIFHEELTDREHRHQNLKVTHVITEPGPDYQGETGFISASLLKGAIDRIEEKMFYVCGPPAMYAFVLKELSDLKIPKRKTRVEVFGAPADITAYPGWPDEIKGEDVFQIRLNGDEPVPAKAGEPLMNALEREGKVIPASCRSGDCSLCRTKLMAGKVFQPKHVRLRKSDQVYHYIHPCMAYPLEDLDLLV